MWLLYVILPAVGIILGWTIRWLYARFQLSSCEQRAVKIIQEATKAGEAKSKEFLLEAKEQLIREQKQQEAENRERRNDLQRFERRLTQKEELLEKRIEATDKNDKLLLERKESLDEKEKFLQGEEEKQKLELERIAGLTREEAKSILVEGLETEAKHDAYSLVSKIESEAQATAEKKARDILISTIQRMATEISSDVTVTTVVFRLTK